MSTDLLDLHPATEQMRAEVLAGLSRQNKHLPSKYFYDRHGAQLFEQICELPEYYPTRTEIGILRDTAAAIATALGPGRAIVEPGSGSGIKTTLLLDAMHQPRAYLPIDIAKDQLQRYAQRLRAQYPQLTVTPICADFTASWHLPPTISAPVVWFPGSTIGNFTRPQAAAFLQRLRQQCGADSELLIGIDLVKPRATLTAAYNDSAGLTARFNLNLLSRCNRELETDFDLSAFAHQAVWNEELQAIQMLLISQREQRVQLGEQSIRFAAGEAICSEYSHKYTISDFSSLARSAGWHPREVHHDARRWFAIFHFGASPRDC